MDKMKHNKGYFVFISYSSLDNEWAIWLRHELEHYHLPASFNGRTDVRDNLRKVFRDRDELSAGPEWDEQVQKALENTNNLIVICSPNSAKSDAVNKEIKTFIDLGKEDHIFPFIVEGDKPEDCFPSALKKSKLGGDVKKDKSPNIAFVKIVAGMLNVSFPELWDRYEIEKAEEEQKIREQREKLLRAQSRFLAEKVNDLVDEGDSYTAKHLAIEALPEDLENPNRPYVIEAEIALRNASSADFTICKGHKGNVVAANYSSDGNYIVSASEDGSIIIWDAKSGKSIQQIYQDERGFKYCQFSPDSQNVASVSGDGKVNIWNVKTQKTTYSFSGCSFVSFHPIDNSLIAGDTNNNINLWTTSGEFIRSYTGHTDSISSAVVSPNGKWIASASYDRNIIIWDYQKGIIKNVLKGHKDIVWRVAFSSDNKYVASASDDKKVLIWDVENGSLIATLNSHNKRVNSVAFSPNNKWVISASSDGTAIIWDFMEDNILKILDGNKWIASDFIFPTFEKRQSIYDAQFSPDGKSILTAHQDETIRLWKIMPFSSYKSLIGHNNNVSWIAFSPDDRYLASVSSDLSIRIWDILNDKSVILRGAHDHFICYISYSPDGKMIASSSADKTIKIWEATSGTLLHTLVGHTDFVRCATFSPDGKFIASASLDKTISIWDTNTGEMISKLLGHKAEVSHVSYSHSGDLIVSSSEDNSIIIWDAKTREPIQFLNGHTSYVYSAYFSHDDKRILSCSMDNTIKIWDIKTGLPINEIIGDTRYIYSAAFSPNDKYIVSAAHGYDVKVWDSNSGTLVRTLKGHEAQVSFAVFNHSGNIIASCSEDRTIILWEFPSLQKIISETREQFKDNPLTPEERKKYYLE